MLRRQAAETSAGVSTAIRNPNHLEMSNHSSARFTRDAEKANTRYTDTVQP